MSKEDLVRKYGRNRASTLYGLYLYRGEAWFQLNHPEAFKVLKKIAVRRETKD